MSSASLSETMSALRDKLTFFRQSGWMVMATVASGVFMSAVHVVVNKPMTPAEYAVFFALLRVFLLMGFPAGGLQIIFARQAAAASSDADERQLSQTVRRLLQATFVVWLLMAAIVFIWRNDLVRTLKIANPAALWVTVVLGLAALWAPILKGILQGRQQFAGLGWVLILDGIGRFVAIATIVQLGGQAAGGMAGALIGHGLSLVIAAWLVRRILLRPGAHFAWRPWLSAAVPLTLGVGVILFMTNLDVVYVQTVFGKDESPFYAPAAMIGLALVTFTGPLAAVMFPKVVQSAARTEKSDALRDALAATALLGALAALACTLMPQLPLRIIYFRNPTYWQSAPLVPWMAWALVPLVLANVLISNLLARSRFQVVPWSLLVAIGYGGSLLVLKERLGLFAAEDVLRPAALAVRAQTEGDSLAAFVWSRLSDVEQERLRTVEMQPELAQSLWAEALNGIIRGPLLTLATPASSQLSAETRNALAAGSSKDAKRLNRLLIQDICQDALVGRSAKLFRDFKKVITTLGTFSLLLLGVAAWCTFHRANAPPKAELQPVSA